MKKLINLLFITFSITLFSQVQSLRDVDGGLYLNTGDKELSLKDIKGSPYLQEKYFYAFVNENSTKPHLMRYNAYLDKMEFDKNGVQHDLENGLYKTVNFDVPVSKKYVYVTYSFNNKNNDGYLVELNAGKNASLFKRERIEFVPERSRPNGLSETHTPAEFKPSKTFYFFKLDNGSIAEMPKSKDKFTKLFGDKSKPVSDYIKKNKFSISDENDLKMIFLYINSL